ncbi:MAG: ABC transporter ATP-binding protein [Deltaproteobacteria bacterium]|nr:ABC transporter ATP-binding protein [Deltaproteobacteria bacterium]
MISVEGLTHYYGERRAVENIGFNIAENEIVGILGLNGAGKSTTLKVLAGLIIPTAGNVRIDGTDLVSASAEFRSRIGYLPEDPPLYKEMTVREFLLYAGQLKGKSAAEVEARLPDVLRTCQVEHVQHRVISELSHGYRKRVGIAQAIVHSPRLVILDEPISGLDPKQIVEMRQVVKKLGKNSTVLISSHILAEISETCDRLLVLNGGKIVAAGRESELAQAAGASGTRITVQVRGEAERVESALRSVSAVQRVSSEADGEGCLRVRVAMATDARESVVAALVTAGLGVRRVGDDESELEAIFLGLTQGAQA